MSAYMVHTAQPAVVASLALRFNRVNVLEWISAKVPSKLDFEAEAQKIISALTPKSTDVEICTALIHLFSATNFQSLVGNYGAHNAVKMACTEEEIAELVEVAERTELANPKADGSTLLPKLALAHYISEAIKDQDREEVKTLIDTTSQAQYLMWFANLRYQSVDFNEYDDSLFESFFKHVAGNVDIGRPEFVDCEWSLRT